MTVIPEVSTDPAQNVRIRGHPWTLVTIVLMTQFEVNAPTVEALDFFYCKGFFFLSCYFNSDREKNTYTKVVRAPHCREHTLTHYLGKLPWHRRKEALWCLMSHFTTMKRRFLVGGERQGCHSTDKIPDTIQWMSDHQLLSWQEPEKYLLSPMWLQRFPKQYSPGERRGSNCHTPRFFSAFWEWELGSLCLCTKQFSHQTTFPALKISSI